MRGKPWQNIRDTGAGALNIDGGRIPLHPGENPATLDGGGQHTPAAPGWDRPYRHDETRRAADDAQKDINVAHAAALGRWPANFYVDETTAPLLDAMSGISKSKRSDRGKGIDGNLFANPNGEEHVIGGHDDAGGASRFFFKAVADKLDDADQVMYTSKASRTERDAGLQDLPRQYGPTLNSGVGAREHSPDEPAAWVRNPHPTVKPLALTTWLGKLLLPPDLYAPRRLFVPFSGVASEMIGGLRACWEFVQGVELDGDGQNYIAVALARLHYWHDALLGETNA